VPKQERNTVYKQYIRTALWGMCCDRVGDFTIEDLSKYCGLSVTTNMRKQLAHAVRDGILYYDFTGDRNSRRGIHYSFSSHWKELANAAENCIDEFTGGTGNAP